MDASSHPWHHRLHNQLIPLCVYWWIGSQRRPSSSLPGFNLMALIPELSFFLNGLCVCCLFSLSPPQVSPSPLLPLRPFLCSFLLLNPFNPWWAGGGKKVGGKDDSTTDHQELNVRGKCLEFSVAVINKREVSVSKIIFRVPMMRQNQRK